MIIFIDKYGKRYYGTKSWAIDGGWALMPVEGGDTFFINGEEEYEYNIVA